MPLTAAHFALTIVLDCKYKTSPGLTHRSVVATNAFTVAPPSAHLQLAISAYVKLNSWLQVKTVPVPPPSVLESNEMAMKEPLLANTALLRSGAGTGAAALSTVNACPFDTTPL